MLSTNNACFSFILIMFHNINKHARWFSWQLSCHSGTGTWVRFPGAPLIFHIFLHNMFPRSASSKDHHASSYACLPRAQEISSKGHNVDSTVHLSQPLHMQSLKVKKGFALLGQNASTNLPNWVRHPHCLYFFSPFLFF